MPLIQYRHILLLFYLIHCGLAIVTLDCLDNSRIWWSRFICAILYSVSEAAAHSFPTLSFYTCFIHKTDFKYRNTNGNQPRFERKKLIAYGQRRKQTQIYTTIYPPAFNMTNRIAIYDFFHFAAIFFNCFAHNIFTGYVLLFWTEIRNEHSHAFNVSIAIYIIFHIFVYSLFVYFWHSYKQRIVKFLLIIESSLHWNPLKFTVISTIKTDEMMKTIWIKNHEPKYPLNFDLMCIHNWICL